MKHLVNTLAFEIRCPDEGFAFTLRHTFATVLQEQIERAVDRICSQNSHERENVQIDRLELDLGVISSFNFDSTLIEAFARKFESAVTEKLRSIPHSEKASSSERSDMDLVQHFLITGRLPWWASEEGVSFEQIFDTVLRSQLERVVLFLLAHKDNRSLWLRIVFQLTVDQKRRILMGVPALMRVHDELIEWIETMSANEGMQTRYQWPVIVADRILSSAVEILSGENGLSYVKQALVPDIGKIFQFDARQFESVVEKLADPHDDGLEDRTAESFSGTMMADQSDLADDEKIFVNQAGIVLLAQFFKPFFSKLALLDGNQWKNKECQYKAIHMLRYLATGEELRREYSMSLEKVLCGLSPSEPVPLDVPFSASEVNECTVLLSSVIEHWKVLKNTSIHGLRESFIRRDGILTIKDGNWLLKVERKTVDVLLDKIPWGFSVIILPWNDQLMHVEW